MKPENIRKYSSIVLFSVIIISWAMIGKPTRNCSELKHMDYRAGYPEQVVRQRYNSCVEKENIPEGYYEKYIKLIAASLLLETMILIIVK